MKVVDVFSSIQGEGPSIGEPAVFVRFAGCNLRCVWCDTKYALDSEDGSFFTISELVTSIKKEQIASGARLIVFTGGEPMLNQHAMSEVIPRLGMLRVEIETNGTVEVKPCLISSQGLPPQPPIRFIVSPKLSSSGIDAQDRIKYAALKDLVKLRNTVWKFACADESDVDEAFGIAAMLFWPDTARPCVVQPVGATSRKMLKVLKKIQPVVTNLGWRILPRLHILLWGNERGR